MPEKWKKCAKRHPRSYIPPRAVAAVAAAMAHAVTAAVATAVVMVAAIKNTSHTALYSPI